MRDPRVDPRPGDVVRDTQASGWEARVISALSRRVVFSVSLAEIEIAAKKTWTLAEWRFEMRNAEVLNAAD